MGVRKIPGLPPGSLIHVGERLVDKVQVSILVFNKDMAESHIDVDLSACDSLTHREGCLTFVQVSGLHDVDKIGHIGKIFGLTDLTLEDILHTSGRSKVEHWKDGIFVIMPVLEVVDGGVDIEHGAIVMLQNAVVVFTESPTLIFDPVVKRIAEGRGRLRFSAVDYLLWAVLDAIVDHHILSLDFIEDRVVEMEDRLLDDVSKVEVKELFGIRHEIQQIYRSVRPGREILSSFLYGESTFITDMAIPFYRDLYDHGEQSLERAEHLRESLSTLRDFHFSATSTRANEVMKVLTSFATIFLPLTFLVGLYGMNFDYMPELHSQWGYPLVLGVCVVTSVGLFTYFRKKRWL